MYTYILVLVCILSRSVLRFCPMVPLPSARPTSGISPFGLNVFSEGAPSVKSPDYRANMACSCKNVCDMCRYRITHLGWALIRILDVVVDYMYYIELSPKATRLIHILGATGSQHACFTTHCVNGLMSSVSFIVAALWTRLNYFSREHKYNLHKRRRCELLPCDSFQKRDWTTADGMLRSHHAQPQKPSLRREANYPAFLLDGRSTFKAAGAFVCFVYL